MNQGVQTRTFAYNSLSRLVSAQNPESGTIQYSCDANGNLTQKTDARGVATAYTYDALNRVLTRTYTGETGYTTPNVSYFYDNLPNAKGRLTKVSSDVSTTEYTAFDILGRVLSAKQTTAGGDPLGYTTGYTYNLSGALIEETYPSGRVVRNELDANGDLSKVESKRSAAGFFRPYAGSFVYTAAGAVSSMRLGNGKFENTVYNSRLQPTQIGLGSSASTQNVLKLNYEYGTAGVNNGNITKQTITVPTAGANAGFTAVQDYTYDELNRLKSAVENVTPADGTASQSWKQTFTFDRYGNRRFDAANTTTLAPGCAEAVCNPQVDPATNRLVGYTFDASGNTTVDAESRQFTYDAENKQVKVETVDGSGNPIATVGEYFYDGDGRRIKKIVPSTGELTIFSYDVGGKLVAEYSTIIASSQDSKVAYLTTDHLGSPRINTDQYGTVIARHDYHPFGEEINGVGGRTTGLNYGSDTIRQKFTGYERDDETSLDFAQARMYVNALGRFATPDEPFLDQQPEDAQSWDLYTYVGNRPLIFVDASGWWKQVECGAGSCWEAEKGDTLNSLARILHVSGAHLAQYFGDVDPNRIDVGHVFDVSGFYRWRNLEAMRPLYEPSIPEPNNRSLPESSVCDTISSCHPTRRDPNIDRLFTKGSGITARNVPSGLKDATRGLRELFTSGTNGSVRNMPIINIRTILRENGFVQSLSRNRSGYLFRNAAGEEVRIMRRSGGWDIRIKNKFGNYLDEFGNVGNPATTHRIGVTSQ